MVYDSIPQISISNNECADSGLITLVDTLSLNLIKKKIRKGVFNFFFFLKIFLTNLVCVFGLIFDASLPCLYYWLV